MAPQNILKILKSQKKTKTIWPCINKAPPARLTTQPEEVINCPEQLHSHVVVDQGILQHACLETQIPDMFPHPSLAALLIMPEEKQQVQKDDLTFSVNRRMN